MYAKEYRRPTPPRNYSGTAFTESPQYAGETPPRQAEQSGRAAEASPCPRVESGEQTHPAPQLSRDEPRHDEESLCERPNSDTERGEQSPHGAEHSNQSPHADHCNQSPGANHCNQSPGAEHSERSAPTSTQTLAQARRPTLLPPGLEAAGDGGMGSEELLLIGLILLLSQGRRDNDALLMLALLLLYR